MNDSLENMLHPFLVSLLVSLGIGFMMGLEREFKDLSSKENFAGLRAFPLTAILGCIITFVSQALDRWILYVSIPSIFLFFSIFYYSKTIKGNTSIATDLSLIIAFFLGVLSALQYFREALAVAVISTVLFSMKNKLRELVSLITQEELYAFVKFIILSLLLLPFLPNTTYFQGVIHLKGIGIVIVITSSISFVGYFVIKFFGNNKGILFTAFFGGTFSSTSVTWVFSGKSKENELLSSQFAAGIILACSVMFVRVLFVSYLFNPNIFTILLFPCLLMFIIGLGFVYYLTKKEKSPTTHTAISLGNPLNISSALLFGALYVGITLFVYFSNIYLGTKGLFITSIISGLTDVDAITISVAKLSKINIDEKLGASVILAAMLSNTIFKLSIALKGTEILRKNVVKGLISCILVGMIFILYMIFDLN